MKRICRFFSIFLILGFLSNVLPAADLYDRGLESLDLMAYSQALQLFERAIADDPNKEDVRVSMALTYLRMLDLRLAYVINFGERLLKDGIHRVVNGLYVKIREKNIPFLCAFASWR